MNRDEVENNERYKGILRRNSKNKASKFKSKEIRKVVRVMKENLERDQKKKEFNMKW